MEELWEKFHSFLKPSPVPQHSRAVSYHGEKKTLVQSGCYAFGFGCKFRLVPIRLLLVLGGKKTQTKDAQKENITYFSDFLFVCFFPTFSKSNEIPLDRWACEASSPCSGLCLQGQVSPSNPKPPPPPLDWQETAHQCDSGPTSASTHASLSLRLQGSQAGKQRPPGLPSLFVCLAWILEAAGIWSVWPQPSCSL